MSRSWYFFGVEFTQYIWKDLEGAHKKGWGWEMTSPAMSQVSKAAKPLGLLQVNVIRWKEEAAKVPKQIDRRDLIKCYKSFKRELVKNDGV